MFLYGCKHESIDFLKSYNLCINNDILIKDAIRNCFDNPNGLPIVSWILESATLTDVDIMYLSTYATYFGQEVMHYWKTTHVNTIQSYCEKMTEKELEKSLHIGYSSTINIIYEYFNANRLIKGIFISTQTKESGKASVDVLNYLASDVDFSKIKEEYYHALLYFFTRHGDIVWCKFLQYQYPSDKKIKVLIRYLALINDTITDPTLITRICSAIIEINASYSDVYK